MHPKVKRALRAAKYEDGGSVDDRSPLRRAVDTGMDYAGRGLALADLYSGGMLTSVAGLNPFGSYNRLMEAREQALDAVPREAKAMATEPISPVAAIFAGPMARTANKTMLRRAEELVAQNAPREQIWNETGWFKGVDGKWRFEIDDSKSYSDMSSAIQDGSNVGSVMPLDHVLGHRKLYDAYPEAANMNLRFVDKGQNPYYRERGINKEAEIGMPVGYTDPATRSHFLHEAQHHVQAVEDFGRGSNPKLFPDVTDSKRMLTDANVLAVMLKKGDSLVDAVARFKSLFNEEPAFGAVGVALSGEKPGNILRRREALKSPQEMYRAHAGEAESRAVQARQGLTPDERRARAPWLDYDVPEADQIVRFR